MLIALDNSIATYLRTSLPSEKEVTALDLIAYNYILGNHILVGERTTLEYLSEFTRISDKARMIYRALSEKTYEFGMYHKLFITKLTIHKLQHITKNKKDNYYLDLNNIKNVSYSILMSEDLSDCYFYDQIIRLMKKINIKYSNIDIKFQHASCIGSQAENHSQNELDKGNFVLLIVDTDKFFSDAAYGDSYKKAYKAFENWRDSRVIGIHTSELKAKENFIPPSEYLRLSISDIKAERTLLVFNKLEKKGEFDIIRYLDIKNGYKIKHYSKLANLSNSFKELFDLLDYEHALNYPLTKLVHMSTDEELEAKLLNGLKGFFLEYFRNGLLDSINLSNQPEFIVSEWQKLFVRAVAWGCSIPEHMMYRVL